MLQLDKHQNKVLFGNGYCFGVIDGVYVLETLVFLVLVMMM